MSKDGNKVGEKLACERGTAPRQEVSISDTHFTANFFPVFLPVSHFFTGFLQAYCTVTVRTKYRKNTGKFEIQTYTGIITGFLQVSIFFCCL